MSESQYSRAAKVSALVFWLSVGSPISPHVRRGREAKKIYSLLSLVLKIKVGQNVNRMSEKNISICQYVRMQLFSLGIKIKVVQNVIIMSDSQKISTDS